MTPEEMVAALDEQGALLADAAGRTTLDVVVPSCPDWTLRELVRHTGMVHRWAASVVEAAGPAVDDLAFEAATVYPPDEALLGWFRDGHQALLTTLRDAQPDVACWAFMRGSLSPLEFWMRRQLHETAVHRMDAELAAGHALSPVPASLAADGIDELLTSFLPRPSGRLRSDDPWTMAVVATDTEGAWTVRVTVGPVVAVREAQPADVTLSGGAGDLYAFLWNRAVEGVAVEGNAARVADWQGNVRIAW
ncbi:maleylpyruvate isomerase family mycothiol-dependent enzyme [Acidothermaceae bacterium B102]|nr:maleylpyruvate isomerase family mycothiol-dependent enzyme [Acidothermaceae bacterium B102]